MKLKSALILLVIHLQCGILFAEGVSSVIYPTTLVGSDHITIIDRRGDRIDLGSQKPFESPAHLAMGGSSSATFIWGGQRIHLDGEGEVVMGSEADTRSFPILATLPRLKVKRDLFLLKGTLWVESPGEDGKRMSMRTPSHLIEWKNAIFRVEIKAKKLLLEVLHGDVWVEDKWYYPGKKNHLKTLNKLSADPTLGDQKGLVSDGRISALLERKSHPQVSWFKALDQRRFDSFKALIDEKLLRKIGGVVDPQRRIETKLLDRETRYQVEY